MCSVSLLVLLVIYKGIKSCVCAGLENSMMSIEMVHLTFLTWRIFVECWTYIYICGIRNDMSNEVAWNFLVNRDWPVTVIILPTFPQFPHWAFAFCEVSTPSYSLASKCSPDRGCVRRPWEHVSVVQLFVFSSILLGSLDDVLRELPPRLLWWRGLISWHEFSVSTGFKDWCCTALVGICGP